MRVIAKESVMSFKYFCTGLFLASLLALSPAYGVSATGSINPSTRYQVLEGFGASGAWYQNYITQGISQPTRNTVYDILFKDSGLDIYRVRNTHEYDNGYIDDTSQIVAAAKARNPNIKIMISSWSPPPRLKNSGSTAGGTLKKDPNDSNESPPNYYKYTAFAQWWADSITDFNNHGVRADYVNMQNEPDYNSTTQDTCKFDTTETSNYAGYNKAFQALYTKLNNDMPNHPKLLVPEAAGMTNFSGYVSVLTSTDKSNIYGWSHHLYNWGDGGSHDNPDGYISKMTTFAATYNDKPRMQTEFARLDSNTLTFTDAMNLAKLLHNSLVYEQVSAYLYWELYWASPKGLVTFPSWGTYAINPVYYAFKHYSAFTDPNWQRIDASTDSNNLRISAYISPDNNQMSIVIINTSTDTNVALDFNSLGNFEVTDGNIYRTNSSLTEKCSFVGAFDVNTLLLTVPKNSITTIALNGKLIPTNCQQVYEYGYILPADLTGDCYVNYEDLETIAFYWLNNNCGELDNCEGADFKPMDGDVNFVDFSKFAVQWRQCNDPCDANCTPNW